MRNSLIGYFILSDTIRDSAPETIAKLQEREIEVVMMSGDKSPVAQYIAEKLGIKTYYGEVTPQQKSRLIEQIQSKNPEQVVAMVGDGIKRCTSYGSGSICDRNASRCGDYHPISGYYFIS